MLTILFFGYQPCIQNDPRLFLQANNQSQQMLNISTQILVNKIKSIKRKRAQTEKLIQFLRQNQGLMSADQFNQIRYIHQSNQNSPFFVPPSTQIHANNSTQFPVFVPQSTLNQNYCKDRRKRQKEFKALSLKEQLKIVSTRLSTIVEDETTIDGRNEQNSKFRMRNQRSLNNLNSELEFYHRNGFCPEYASFKFDGKDKKFLMSELENIWRVLNYNLIKLKQKKIKKSGKKRIRTIYIPEKLVWVCGKDTKARSELSDFVGKNLNFKRDAYLDFNSLRHRDQRITYYNLMKHILKKGFKNGMVIDGLDRDENSIHLINFIRKKCHKIFKRSKTFVLVAEGSSPITYPPDYKNFFKLKEFNINQESSPKNDEDEHRLEGWLLNSKIPFGTVKISANTKEVEEKTLRYLKRYLPSNRNKKFWYKSN